MKSNSTVVAVACVALLSGCAMWDAGYTTNSPVTRYQLDASNKYPITYSVTMATTRGDAISVPTVQSLREKLEASLLETGLFSSVSYGNKEGEDSYHVDFSFQQGGSTPEQSMGAGLLAGCTLFLCPSCEIMTFDGTAKLYLKGKPIYSTAKAEELRCLIWLPMAPVGLVMNAWTCWFWAERGSVHALVNDIATEHRHRFLADAEVGVMIDD